MDIGTGFRTRLLCQQVYHVELLKCRKHGNQHRGSNNRADCGNCNKVRPLEPVCAIENCTLVAAMIHRLQSTIHNHNHKRQRQPKVDNRAAEKCRDIVCQPAHCRQPQLLHPLVQQAELRIEDAVFPKQDRHSTKAITNCSTIFSTVHSIVRSSAAKKPESKTNSASL